MSSEQIVFENHAAQVAKYVAAIANSIADASSAAGNPATFQWAYQGPSINANANGPLVTTDVALQQLFAWFNANGGQSRPFVGTSIPGVATKIVGGLDSPNVIGRHGARSALIWFSVAGAILLFFVGHNMNTLTFLILLLAALMGIWIFVRPMERVHRRIRAAKHVELEATRREIEAARLQAPHDAAAAAKLQSLLAYEARIENVREWPFDQSTMVRVGAYLFIPAIPWFGQAFAQRLIDTVAH